MEHTEKEVSVQPAVVTPVAAASPGFSRTCSNNVEVESEISSLPPIEMDVDDNDEESIETQLRLENELLKQEIRLLRAERKSSSQRRSSRGRANSSSSPQNRVSRSLSPGPMAEVEFSVDANGDAGLHHRRGVHEHPIKLLPRQFRRSRNDLYSKVSQEDLSDSTDDLEANTDRIMEHAAEEEESTFWTGVADRAGWLVGLLVLQSLSSFIISRNEILLQKHLVIVQFLTMLVGAGGNAGNQSSVRVIRGLALGTIHNENQRAFLLDEIKIGATLSAVLGIAGCLRAAVFLVPLPETVAITVSLCTIVWTSVLLGAILPLVMKHLHVDPAHSSTTIQVLMDILGVTITVYVSGLVLNSGIGEWMVGEE